MTSSVRGELTTARFCDIINSGKAVDVMSEENRAARIIYHINIVGGCSAAQNIVDPLCKLL